MPQTLNSDDWKPIRFESTLLPASLMGISILIHIESFPERTGDWIWALPHCKGMEKRGDAAWCLESATTISDYLLENRSEILQMIAERLGPHGFAPDETLAEWMTSLAIIRETAAQKSGDCSWIAEMPGDDPTPLLERVRRFLDSNGPPA
jgi:hypothetical protein